DWREGTLAGVGDALAVLGDVGSLAIDICVSELTRERERRLGHLYDLARITWRVQRIVVAQSRPGQDLEVLDGVTADQREMLQIVGRNQSGLFPGIRSCQFRDPRFNNYSFGAGTEFQLDLHGATV